MQCLECQKNLTKIQISKLIWKEDLERYVVRACTYFVPVSLLLMIGSWSLRNRKRTKLTRGIAHAFRPLVIVGRSTVGPKTPLSRVRNAVAVRASIIVFPGMKITPANGTLLDPFGAVSVAFLPLLQLNA